MAGAPAPGAPILVEPVGTVGRLSTESMAIDDPAVAAALRLIRQHAGLGKGVDELADRTGLSLRALQRRFKSRTGRTLQEEIHNVRLARVRQMLAESDLKLEAIARKAGFHYIGYMSSVFKKQTGMTPGEYRRLHAGGGPRTRLTV
jgi:LacI family transcriptional regulator